MAWQVLFSAEETPRPDRRLELVGPEPVRRRPLNEPRRIRPVSLTIRTDGTLRATHDDEDDLD